MAVELFAVLRLIHVSSLRIINDQFSLTLVSSNLLLAIGKLMTIILMALFENSVKLGLSVFWNFNIWLDDDGHYWLHVLLKVERAR